MKFLALVMLAACALPHVPTEPRTSSDQDATVVRVDVSCSEPSPFKTGEPGDPHAADPDIVWVPSATGTGVIISERHVLTAAHVVFCPIIPDVVVTLPDGRWFDMLVEHDAAMFGDGTDLARLVIASADHFGLNVSPPRLAPRIISHDCIVTRRGRACGPMTWVGDSPVVRAPSYPGDSGAPVYDAQGNLTGLVVGGDNRHTMTTLVRVTPWWLLGT